MALRKKHISKVINDQSKQDGAIIKADKFITMLDNFDKSEYAQLLGKKIDSDYPRAITFDKKIIKKVLNQRGCEKVRFYFCLEDSNDLSSLTIAICGVRKNNNDLVFFKNNNSDNSLEIANFELSANVVEDGTGHPPKKNGFVEIVSNIGSGSTVINFLELLRKKNII